MERAFLWAMMVLVVGASGAIYLLLPRISRRGLLFGVYVGEERWACEEARRITRSWVHGMLLWLAASVLAGAGVGIWLHPAVATPVAGLLASAGFLVLYLRAYLKARRLAPPGGPPPAVALVGGPEPLPTVLPFVALALGVVGGLAAIGYAWFSYPALPAMVPTHFGPSGRPDDWHPRSFWTVMLLPLMTLVMGVGLGGVAMLTSRAKRAIRAADRGVSLAAQLAFRNAMARVLAAVALSVTAMLTLLSFSSIRVALGQAEALPPAMWILLAATLLSALGGTIYVAIRHGQGGSRQEAAAATAPLTDGLADNRHWVLGMLYVNRDDPSIMVEHRFGLGYTINFGNPRAVALFVGFMVLVIGLTVAALVKS